MSSDITALAAKQMFEAGKRNWQGAMWASHALGPGFRIIFLRGGFLDGYRGALISQNGGAPPCG